MEPREKRMIVTGATSGIGRQTAVRLAGMGARVVIHGRTEEKCRDALEEVERETGNRSCEIAVADLSSLAEVRRLAEEVRDRFGELHVLVNNAGVYRDSRETSADGIELTFAVNQVAPFLLTRLLVDTLAASAPSRVVVVASASHKSASLRDLAVVTGEARYDGYTAYAVSKLANVAFAYSLAERLEGTGVTSNSLHPGVVGTKLLRAGFPGSSGMSPEEGAEAPTYVATADELDGVSGRYFNRMREGRSSRQSRDERVRAALWETTEEMAQLR